MERDQVQDNWKNNLGVRLLLENLGYFLLINAILYLIAVILTNYLESRVLDGDIRIDNISGVPINSDTVDTLALGGYFEYIPNYFRPGTGFQFATFTFSILLGLVVAYAMIRVIQKLLDTDKTIIRKIIANPIWVFLTIILLLISFFLLTSNIGDIYDEFENPGGLTFFHIGNLLLLMFTSVVTGIMIVQAYYKQSPSNDIKRSLIKETLHLIPYVFVFFMLMANWLNLPFVSSSILSDFYLGAIDVNSRPVKNTLQTTYLSGFFLLSLYLIVPRILLSIIQFRYNLSTIEIQEKEHERQLNEIGDKGTLNFIGWLIAIVIFGIGVYLSFLALIGGVGSISSNLQQKTFGGFWSPYHVNIQQTNQPPGSEYFFGTDYLGRDIFSRVMFALGAIIPIVIYVSILRTVFATGILKLTEYLPSNVNNYLFQFFEEFPSLIILIIIGPLLHYNFDSLLQVVLMSSFLFFSRSLSLSRNILKEVPSVKYIGVKSFYSRIIISNLAAIFMEFVIVSYAIGGFTGLDFGSTLLNAIQNYPTRYWWGLFFPVLTIFTIYLLLSLASQLIGFNAGGKFDQQTDQLYPEEKE